MFKKTLLTIIFVLSVSVGNAADYYFSSGTGGNITAASSNSNSCSLASPCVDPNGKGLSGVGSLSPGDNLWFDAGDTWNITGVWIRSNGTSANRITLKGYGDGKAKFTSMQLYASGWTNYSGEIWYMGGITWTDYHIYIVMEGLDSSTAKGLFKWGEGYGSNALASMPRQHFWFSASENRIYIRRSDGANPNTTGDMYLPNTTTAPAFNGGRGIICTGCETGSTGAYVDIDMTHMEIVGSNGMGISLGGPFDRVYDSPSDRTDVDINGCGGDCILHYYGQVAGELANDNIVDGIRIKHGAASGTGHGQSFTTYAPRTLWINVDCSDSAMACFDHLQGFDSISDVTGSAIKNFTIARAGMWGDPRGYDPGYYADGASNVTIKDGTCSELGIGSNGAGQSNTHACYAVGSEHPDTDPATNVDIANVSCTSAHYECLHFGNLPNTSSNIGPVRVAHATFVARRSSTSDMVFNSDNLSTTAGSLTIKNSILYAEDATPVNNWMGTGDTFTFDYNGYYKVGGSDTNLYRTGGGTYYNFAGWKAATLEDSHSRFENPLFVSDSEGSYDLHLQSSSTYVDAGTPGAWACPSYLYSQWPSYFPECAPGGTPISGSTSAGGELDNINAAPDLGYHFPSSATSATGTLTSASVSHSSGYTSTEGSLTVQATLENAWPADGRLTVTLDPDYAIDSGGTTTATCASGCDGSLSVSLASGILTLTRVNSADAPTTPVIDDFNRANTGPPMSANWTTLNGDGWKVVSNRAQTQTSSGGWSNDYWSPTNYQNLDAYATVITKPADGACSSIQTRWDTTTDASYGLRLCPQSGVDSISITRYSSGVLTNLATYSQEVSSGDSIRISIYNSSLRAYYKTSSGSWTTLGSSVTDNVITAAGKLGLFADNASAVVLDDFGGGTITSEPNASGATQTSASTAITVVLSHILSPSSPQTTDSYSLSTTDNGGSIIDEASGLSGSTFSSAPSSGTKFTASGNFTITGSYTIGG